MGLKLLLHAGCGSRPNKPPREFAAYKEIRLDCNPLMEPDILASIAAMPTVEAESFDAVYCSHVLEHLFAHEVPMALREFHRVLKPDGQLLIKVPDLQSIGGKLALDQADHILYQSAMGVIAPLDMIYGLRSSIAAGNQFMAHRTGFTASVLRIALGSAGFVEVETDRTEPFELKGIARKDEAHASQKSSAKRLLSGPLRASVDEGTSFRKQGEVAEARRQVSQEENQAEEEVMKGKKGKVHNHNGLESGALEGKKDPQADTTFHKHNAAHGMPHGFHPEPAYEEGPKEGDADENETCC